VFVVENIVPKVVSVDLPTDGKDGNGATGVTIEVDIAARVGDPVANKGNGTNPLIALTV
jgi:hypothetical protein